MLRITQHARDRFRERIHDGTDEQIDAELSCRSVLIAAAFGAEYVRLGTGHRIVINDGAIVTVLPKGTRLGTLDRRAR